MEFYTEEKIMNMLEEKGINKGKVEDALNDKKEKAEEILHDEEKVNKLIDSVLKLCDRLSRIPVIGTVFTDVPLACMLISDYVKGNYKEVPIATVITLTAAVIYVVSPIDMIPDVIPFLGQLDDAAVIGIAFRAAHNDLIAYATWRENQMYDFE